MNILFISPQIPLPQTEGGKKSIFGIAKHLSELGHTIHFVTYQKNHDSHISYNELKKYFTPYILDVKTPNNPLKAFLNLFSSIPYNISKYETKKMKGFLVDFFKREKVDIVHVHNTHMAWTVEFIRRISNVPMVLKLDNVEMMIMKRFAERQTNFLLKLYTSLQYMKFLKYEPQICSKFDCCITISSEDEKQLLLLNPKIKVKTIPIGIEKELFQITNKVVEGNSIVHIGNLNWLPNLDSLQWFLNEIFPNVLKSNPELILYIYGGGNVHKLKIHENLKDNIVFKGFVDDIFIEVKDKNLIIVPLRIGSGIRVKILEMMALGKNIITTSIGKEGLDLVDQKHILIADTKEDFIKKMINFFNDKYDNQQMIIDGRAYVELNYDWAKISKDFEQLYLNLIQK